MIYTCALYKMFLLKITNGTAGRPAVTHQNTRQYIDFVTLLSLFGLPEGQF